MGFHFSTGFSHFRRNSQFGFHLRNLAIIFSPFSTFSFHPKTFSHVFQECSRNKANEAGRQAHARMIVSGFKPTVIDSNCLLQMYIKCSRLDCASKMFDRMPERDCVSWNTMMFGYSVNRKMGLAQSLFDLMPQRDVISWNSLISGYLRSGNCLKAVEVFVMMGRDDVAYNRFTLSLVLKACASLQDNVLGVQIHGTLVRLGLGFHLVTISALMSMYANCRMFIESLQIYVGMLRLGIEPDGSAYSIVLKACAGGEALQHGREVHGRIIKCGMGSDSFVTSTMIDMYCKCGVLADAEKVHERLDEQTLVDMYSKCGNMQDSVLVFRKSSNRDVVTWTSIIRAYARHSSGHEALQAFEEMLLEKVTPNHVTFTGVLSACAHTGLVDEALHYFHMMKAEYGLEPAIEQYSCVVDALGRCGRIMDALKLIQVMPLKAHDAIWRSLLSNCKMHGNVKVAEIAARNLLQLDPRDCSTYVLLSQTYTNAGMWDEASKARRMMRSRRVKIRPGRSMIVAASSI